MGRYAALSFGSRIPQLLVISLGLLDADQFARAADVSNIKAETLPAGRSLPHSEIVALFGACADATPAGARDAALIATLYGAGLRRAEVVALDLDDYDAESGGLKVRGGKGNKSRQVYLPAGATRAVTAWLQVRGTDPGPFFTRIRKGGGLSLDRMSAAAVYQRLQLRAGQAGVPSFSPHDLRRSWTSDMLDAGADVLVVQQLAGHASPTTTSRYDRRGDRAKQAAAAGLHVPYSSGADDRDRRARRRDGQLRGHGKFSDARFDCGDTMKHEGQRRRVRSIAKPQNGGGYIYELEPVSGKGSRILARERTLRASDDRPPVPTPHPDRQANR